MKRSQQTSSDGLSTVWAVERGEYADRGLVALFISPTDAITFVLDNQRDWTPERNEPGFDRYFISAYPLFARPVGRHENWPDMADFDEQLEAAYATLSK